MHPHESPSVEDRGLSRLPAGGGIWAQVGGQPGFRLAGLITAFGNGLTTIIITAFRFTVGGGQAMIRQQLRQLPPEILQQWRDLGLNPDVLANPGLIVGASAIGCGIAMVVAAGLGAAGGAIYVSLSRRESTLATPPEQTL